MPVIMTIASLPIESGSYESNLVAIERMASQCNSHKEIEGERWKALSDDEKNMESERASLCQGFVKCPKCKTIPMVYWSLSRKFELDPVVFCYGLDDHKLAELEEMRNRPCCASHGPHSRRLEIMDMRFETLEEAVKFWNSLIHPCQ